ncbi:MULTISPECIES: hypothetical protein [unclassified Pseudomonas]|uniref:hypothetical protein n=1 Tax=unclassified Pseudomonas TaxID=196821 RepID=UPI00159F7362|nr:hypothetical protein [Pseudomonas sp. D4002]NWB20227.1 hypothetical protein [Pseudomonas sp. D4002]
MEDLPFLSHLLNLLTGADEARAAAKQPLSLANAINGVDPRIGFLRRMEPETMK